jgi:hypothetical protein
MKLPLDIIGVIAKQLIADGSYGTCAALNVTCKAVFQETLRILWKRLVLWGAKLYSSLPRADWNDPRSSGAAKKATMKKVSKIWLAILKSKGAAHVQ